MIGLEIITQGMSDIFILAYPTEFSRMTNPTLHTIIQPLGQITNKTAMHAQHHFR